MQNMERQTARFGSYHDAVEAIFKEPWCDGLPVVPPTPELVDSMIAAGGQPGERVLGVLPGRQLSLQVWQAATCAVMAGCRADYFPVVLATWDGLLDARFNLHAAISSTGGAGFAAVVSGPYAQTIGMNSGTGLFGSGNRANATIGRAIRLGVMTAFKAVSGELDAGSFGHGGKYSFHFAESPPPAPWRSIREQLGFPASATTVTVMPAEAPRQIMHRMQPSADDMLRTLASPMRDPSQNGTGTDSTYIVAIGPEHAGVLMDAGLTQKAVREGISRYSALSADDVVLAGQRVDRPPPRYHAPDASGRIANSPPEHILVVTAGGHGAGWSAVIPSWTWAKHSLPVTKAVRLPGDELVNRKAAASELDFA